MKKEFWSALKDFYLCMQSRFRDKEKQYKDSWKTADIQSLRLLLHQQCKDWVQSAGTKNEPKELVDLANRAFTVWARIEPPTGKSKPVLEAIGSLFNAETS